ncbi:flagellar hook-associated protein 2 [Nocardioides terrae]|uniref:Flagellar hook-associated protein 2 n=1 Tax=Nocardioides terrae TaxID=574651 RepID=A0A1I1I8D2_9ACTN|nr:flagellar filament capping protein FliD [Nocardioides terrae]SFC32424.1 flagellar hook-associated protein 2 [Nocardioides terrae]
MASAITFTGLGSGLDSASIISQLMAIEKAPQDRLKTTLASEQTTVGALQGLNTALVALQKSADSFATGSTWTKLTATSSSTAVKISASSSASQASVSMTVNDVATAASNTYTTAAGLSDTVTSATSLDVKLSDGTTASVALADGKLSTVISSLNGLKDANGTPLLNATAVSTGNGQYRLVVSQVATGQGNLDITEPSPDGIQPAGALMGGPDTTIAGGRAAGTDADITVGGVHLAPQRSNTFTALMPGVDVTLTAAAKGAGPITLAVADDGSSRAGALSAFVSQINGVIDQIADTTSYGVIVAGQAPSGGGVLPGDTTLRAISDQLLNTIFPGGGATLAKMGLDLNTEGHLTFDQSKFQTAYQTDPKGVQDAFIGANGFTSRVGSIAKSQSDSSTGALTLTIKSENSQIDRYNDEIAAWDERLAMKQTSLTKQYTALETVLSKLQSQSSWLTTQLKSLTSSSDD